MNFNINIDWDGLRKWLTLVLVAVTFGLVVAVAVFVFADCGGEGDKGRGDEPWWAFESPDDGRNFSWGSGDRVNIGRVPPAGWGNDRYGSGGWSAIPEDGGFGRGELFV